MWTAGMRRMAAGRVVTATMTGAAALWPFVVSKGESARMTTTTSA
jgi:hypothetical protein